MPAPFYPSKGSLLCYMISVPDNPNRGKYDSTYVDDPLWESQFSETINYGSFSYLEALHADVPVPGNYPFIAWLPFQKYTLALTIDDIPLGNASDSVLNIIMEFIDANGALVVAIKANDGSLDKHYLFCGSDLDNLVSAGGGFPQISTRGEISFTPTQLVFTQTGGSHTSFTYDCDTSRIAGLRVTNLLMEVRNYSGYSTAGVDLGVKISLDIVSAPTVFTGSFASLTSAAYLALGHPTYKPAGATLTHTQGVGLTASGSKPSYVEVRGILPEQTMVLFDVAKNVIARVSYLGGVLTLTFGNEVRSVPCSEPQVSLSCHYRQLLVHGQAQVYIRSYSLMPTSVGAGLVAPAQWLELQPGAVVASIGTERYTIAPDDRMTNTCHVGLNNVFNQEARLQFQPKDLVIKPGRVSYSGPAPSPDIKLRRTLRSDIHLHGFRDDSLPSDLGFIAGRTLVKGVPVKRRLLCMDINGNLIDTIWSTDDGYYRFDYLWLGAEYMVISQDPFDNHRYNPSAMDMKKPEPYQ